MLATLGGVLALTLGLAILFLPLLFPELSRPRDASWGAVVLFLGLVLVTSSDRLTGSPMLGVLCAGLLIGRLGLEVAQSRWRLLSADEQLAIRSAERWQRSLQQLLATLSAAGQLLGEKRTAVVEWSRQRQQAKSKVKRWIRPEAVPTPAGGTPTAELHAEARPDGEAGLDQQTGQDEPTPGSTPPAGVGAGVEGAADAGLDQAAVIAADGMESRADASIDAPSAEASVAAVVSSFVEIDALMSGAADQPAADGESFPPDEAG